MLKVVGLLLSFGVCAAAMAQQADPTAAEQEGFGLARTFCSSCHLITRTDPGPVPDGIPGFPSIADRHLAAPAIRAQIINPAHPVMPQTPLSNAQIDAVVAYIRSLDPGA